MDIEQLKGAKKDLAKLISDSKCNPIIVRLGWHDAGALTQPLHNMYLVLASPNGQESIVCLPAHSMCRITGHCRHL